MVLRVIKKPLISAKLVKAFAKRFYLALTNGLALTIIHPPLGVGGQP